MDLDEEEDEPIDQVGDWVKKSGNEEMEEEEEEEEAGSDANSATESTKELSFTKEAAKSE